jgi:lipopolysaccharide/colanic/teichoic acid biosynthesis glycosyltransferase
VPAARTSGLAHSSARLKRAFDVCAAAVVLVVDAPLFGLIAFLVKLDGPEPVIFAQTRVGRHGEAFRMLKFRTMVDGADDLKPLLLALNETEGLFKIARDPRVTRVGAGCASSHSTSCPSC